MKFYNLGELTGFKYNNIVLGATAVIGVIGGIYLLTQGTKKVASRIAERRTVKRKQDEHFCNICFKPLDTNDFQACIACFSCAKYICREKCSEWVPSDAAWRCRLCTVNRDSYGKTSTWVEEQYSVKKTIPSYVHPMRARSEIYIPLCDPNDSAFLCNFESVSEAPSSINVSQKQQIREYIEEVLAEMLGGTLDSTSVGPLLRNGQYFRLFRKYHEILSRHFIVLEHYLQRWFGDNSTPGNENELQNVSHARLRRLIESIIAETARQPRSASPENSRFNQQLNSLSYNGNHYNGNAGQYFEPKKYQDLLATAVLNKIVDTHGNGRYSESSPDLTSSAFDKNHNSLFPSKTDESISSSSSIEPRSESSLTDPLNNINKGDDVLSPTGSYGNFYADVANENIEADRESVLSDFIASHMVPLPTISAEPASEEDIEDEDFISVASSGRDPTWEDNWLFKKKRCSTTASSVGMLVPAPKEDIRALIGDKTTDEISDLSEVGSDTDDSSQEMVSANTEPLNGRLLNQHLIGGKNTKVVLDELVEQSSLISTSSLPENAPLYTETKNDFVVSNDGLCEAEQISLSNCNTAVSNEAVNCNVTKSVPNESTEKTGVSAKEVPNTEEISDVVPPNDYTDDEKMRNLMAKFNEEQEGKQVDGEETFSISPRSSTSGPLSAEITRPELDQHEGITSFCEDQSNEIDASLRRPSVIEILAAIALGPMLAVSTSDDKNMLTEMEVSSLMELNQLAMAELNAKNSEGHTNTLGVIPEEPPDHEELQITRIEEPDVLTSPKMVMDVVKDLEEFQGTNVATENSSSTEMTIDTIEKRKSESPSQENSPKAINHSINCGFDILAPPMSFSDGTSALSEAHIAPNVDFFSNKVLISQDLVETQTTPGNLSVGISGIEEKVYRKTSENIYMKDNSEMHIVAYDQKQITEDKSLIENESLLKEIEGTTPSPVVTTIKSATDAEIISKYPIEEQNVEEKHRMVNKEFIAGQTVEAQNPEIDLPVKKAFVNTEIAQETNINKPDSKGAAPTIRADFNNRIEKLESPTENVILAQNAVSQSTNEQQPEEIQSFITAAVAQKPFTEQSAETSKHKEIPLIKDQQESINKILMAETIKEVLEPASLSPPEETPPITVPPNTEVTTDITIEQLAKSLHAEASEFLIKPEAQAGAVTDTVLKETDQALNDEKIVLVSEKTTARNSNIEAITVQPAEIRQCEETTPAFEAVPPCTNVIKDQAVEQPAESSTAQERGPGISTSETTETVAGPDVEKVTETSNAERAVPAKQPRTAHASQEPAVGPKENEITPETKVPEAKQATTRHIVEHSAVLPKSEASPSARSTSDTTDTVLRPETSNSEDTTPEIGVLKACDASRKQTVKLPAEAKEEEITLKLKATVAKEAAMKHPVEKPAESPNSEETSIGKSATETPSTVDTELVIEAPKTNDAGQSSAGEQLAEQPKKEENTPEAKASEAKAKPVVEQPVESPKSEETASELSASDKTDTVPKPEAEQATESSNTDNITLKFKANNANQNRAAEATAPACSQSATEPVVKQAVKSAETAPSISASDSTDTVPKSEAEKATEDMTQPPKATEKDLIPEVKASVASEMISVALSEQPDGLPNGQETASAFATPEIVEADLVVQKATKTSKGDETAANITASVTAVPEDNNPSLEPTAEQPAERIYGKEIIPEVRPSETTKTETSNSEDIGPEIKAPQSNDASQTPTFKQHAPEVSAPATKLTAIESLVEQPAASAVSEETAPAIPAADTTDTILKSEDEHATETSNTDNTQSETTTPVIAAPEINDQSQDPTAEQPVERIERVEMAPKAAAPGAKQTATEAVIEQSTVTPACEEAAQAISAPETTDTVPKSEAEQAGETSNNADIELGIETPKTVNTSQTPANEQTAEAQNEEELVPKTTPTATLTETETVFEEPAASPKSEQTAPAISAPNTTDTIPKSEAAHAIEMSNTDNTTSEIRAPVIGTSENNNQNQDTTAEQSVEKIEGEKIPPDDTAPLAKQIATESVVEMPASSPASEETVPTISTQDTTDTAPESVAEHATETSNAEDTAPEIGAPKTTDASHTPSVAPNEKETTPEATQPASEETAPVISEPDTTNTAPKSKAEYATEISNIDNMNSEIATPVIVAPETNDHSQDPTAELPIERIQGEEITPEATAPAANETATEAVVGMPTASAAFEEPPTTISVADTTDTAPKLGSEHAPETSNAEEKAPEIDAPKTNEASQTRNVKQPDEIPKEEETIPETTEPATQTGTESVIEQPAPSPAFNETPTAITVADTTDTDPKLGSEHLPETSNAEDRAAEIEAPKTNEETQTPNIKQPDEIPKEEETIPETTQPATQTAIQSVVEQPAASPAFEERPTAIPAANTADTIPKSENEHTTETSNTYNTRSEITAPVITALETNDQSQDPTAEQPVERIEGEEITPNATAPGAKQTETEAVIEQSAVTPACEAAAPAISALDTTDTVPKSDAEQTTETSNPEDTIPEIEAPKAIEASQTQSVAPNEKETSNIENTQSEITSPVIATPETNNQSQDLTAEQPVERIEGEEITPEATAPSAKQTAPEAFIEQSSVAPACEAAAPAISALDTTDTVPKSDAEQATPTSNPEDTTPEIEAPKAIDASQTPSAALNEKETTRESTQPATQSATGSVVEQPAASPAYDERPTAIPATNTTDSIPKSEDEHATETSNIDNTRSEITAPVIAKPKTNNQSQDTTAEQPVERTEGEEITPNATAPGDKQTATEAVIEQSAVTPACEAAAPAISAPDTTDTVPKSDAEQATPTSNPEDTTPEIEAPKAIDASQTPSVALNEKETTREATQPATQSATGSVVEQPAASPAFDERPTAIPATNTTDSIPKSEDEHATETSNIDNTRSEITAPVIAKPKTNNQSQDTTAEQPVERTEGEEITPNAAAPGAKQTATEAVIEQSAVTPACEAAAPAISAPDTTDAVPKSDAEPAIETSNIDNTQSEITSPVIPTPKTNNQSQDMTAEQPVERIEGAEMAPEATAPEANQTATEAVIKQATVAPVCEEADPAISAPDTTDIVPKSEAERPCETSNNADTALEIEVGKTNDASQTPNVEQPDEAPKEEETTPEATPAAMQSATESVVEQPAASPAFEETVPTISTQDTTDTVTESDAEHTAETSNAEDTTPDIEAPKTIDASQTPSVAPNETTREATQPATQSLTESVVQQPAASPAFEETPTAIPAADTPDTIPKSEDEYTTETSNIDNTQPEITAPVIATPKTNNKSQDTTADQPVEGVEGEEIIPEATAPGAKQTATEAVIEQSTVTPACEEAAPAILAPYTTDTVPKSDAEPTTETSNAEDTAPEMEASKTTDASQTPAVAPNEKETTAEATPPATQSATESVIEQTAASAASEETAPAISEPDTINTAPKSEAEHATKTSNIDNTKSEIANPVIAVPETNDQSQYPTAELPVKRVQPEEITPEVTAPASKQTATEAVIEQSTIAPSCAEAAPAISALYTTDTIPKSEAEQTGETANNAETAFEIEVGKTNNASQTPTVEQPDEAPKEEETSTEATPAATQSATASVVEQPAASPASEETVPKISRQDTTDTAPESDAEHATDTSNVDNTRYEITTPVIAALETNDQNQDPTAKQPVERIEGEEITQEATAPGAKQTATEAVIEQSSVTPAFEEAAPKISAPDTTDTIPNSTAEQAGKTSNNADIGLGIETPKTVNTSQTPSVKQTAVEQNEEKIVPKATPTATQTTTKTVFEPPAASPKSEQTAPAIPTPDTTDTIPKSEAEHATETSNIDNTQSEITSPVIATPETNNQSQDPTAEQPVERIEGEEITPEATAPSAKQTVPEAFIEQSTVAPACGEAAPAISAPDTTDTVPRSEAEQAGETSNNADTALEIEVEKTNDASQTPTVEQPDEAPKEEKTTPEATPAATQSTKECVVEQPAVSPASEETVLTISIQDTTDTAAESDAEHATDASNVENTAPEIEASAVNDESQRPALEPSSEAPNEKETTAEATQQAMQSATESAVEQPAASATSEEAAPAISEPDTTNTAPKSEAEHSAETSNIDNTKSEIATPISAAPETYDQSQDPTAEQPVERIEEEEITPETTAQAKQTGTEAVMEQSTVAPACEEAAPAISAPDTTDTVPKLEAEQAGETSKNADIGLEIGAPKINDTSETSAVKQPAEARKVEETTPEATASTATQKAAESLVEQIAASPKSEETATAVSTAETIETVAKPVVERSSKTSNMVEMSPEVNTRKPIMARKDEEIEKGKIMSVVRTAAETLVEQPITTPVTIETVVKQPAEAIDEEQISPEVKAPPAMDSPTAMEYPAELTNAQGITPAVPPPETNEPATDPSVEELNEKSNKEDAVVEVKTPKTADASQERGTEKPAGGEEITTECEVPGATKTSKESVVEHPTESQKSRETAVSILAPETTEMLKSNVTAPVIAAIETTNAGLEPTAEQPAEGIDEEKIIQNHKPSSATEATKKSINKQSNESPNACKISAPETTEIKTSETADASQKPAVKQSEPAEEVTLPVFEQLSKLTKSEAAVSVNNARGTTEPVPEPANEQATELSNTEYTAPKIGAPTPDEAIAEQLVLAIEAPSANGVAIASMIEKLAEASKFEETASIVEAQETMSAIAAPEISEAVPRQSVEQANEAAKTELIEERTPVIDTPGSTEVIPKLVADLAINSSKAENTSFVAETYLDADEDLKPITEQTAERTMDAEFVAAVEATIPTEMVTDIVNELFKTATAASGIAIQIISGVVLQPISKSSDKTPKTEKTAVIETKETFNKVLEPTDIQPVELPKNGKSALVIEVGTTTTATKFAAEETSPDILAPSVVATTTEPLLSNELVPRPLINKPAKSARAEGAGLVNKAPEISKACLYENVEQPAESRTTAPVEEQETCATQLPESTKDEESKPLTGAVGDCNKDSIPITERPSKEPNDIRVESVHGIEKAASTTATTGLMVEQPAETQTDKKTTRATAEVVPEPAPEQANEKLKARNITLAMETPPTADKELKPIAGKEAEVPVDEETAPATEASKSSNACSITSVAQQSTIAPRDKYFGNVIDATSTADGSPEVIPEQAEEAKRSPTGLLTTPTAVAALIAEKAPEALKDDEKETEMKTLSAIGTLTGLVVELPAETPKAPKTSQAVPSQVNEQLSENTSTGIEEAALAIAEKSSEIPVVGVTSVITQGAVTIDANFETITAQHTGVDKEHLLVIENTSAAPSPTLRVNIDSGTADQHRRILDTNNISKVSTFPKNTFTMNEDKASGVKIETINNFTSQVSEAITEIVTEPQEIPPIRSISTTCKPITHSPLQSTESLCDTAQNPKEVYDEISHPALEVSRNKSVPCLADELKMAAAKNDVKQLAPKRVRPQSIESIIRYFTAELHTPKPHAQNSLKGNHNHNNQLTPNAMQNSFSRQSQSQSFTTPLTTTTTEPTEPKYRGSRFRKLTIENRRFLAELEKRRRQKELIQNYLDTLATIETPSYLTEDLYLESNCFVESTPFSLFSEPPDSIVGATSSSSSARKYFLNNILFSDRISSDSNNTDESTTTVIDTYSYSASLRGSSTDSDSGGEFSRDESTNRDSTTDTATATTITTNTLSTNNITNQSHINSQLLPLPELKTESACSKLQVVETRTSGGNEEHVDDDPLKHLVPGSIAEREYKKWYNAVDMPNNPYSAEALRRRLSGGHERVIDLPNISPCVEEKPIVLNEDENKVIDDKSQQRDYTRYSRDYYINDAKHASGATKKRFTPTTTPSLTDSPSIKTPSTSSPSSIEIEDRSEGTMVSQYPVRSMCYKLEKQSSIEKEPDVYTATPARVEEIIPEQVFAEIEPQIASTISPLTTEAVGKLSSDSNSVPTTDSLTPSEDSDTVRIYDLKKQETRIVKDYQPSVPNTPKKSRPTDLDITPIISEPNTIVSTPSKSTTPTPFKFLQPKRKLIDPSQVLSIDLDIEPVSPTSTEKTVIEQEVVQSLPSVRALAQAFLLTSSSCPASDKWRKARARSPAAPAKTTTPTPVATLAPTPATAPSVAVDQKLPEPQIIADTISQESEDATIASDLSSLETDPPSKREANTSDSLALSQEPSQDRTLSPVLVPGCLKNNIAFFENLKNK